jgi:hypothetical protein
MGKAVGIGSQFRGKVGNVIGYLSKNRAGRYEQTVKGYQPVVANPQSYAQALARVPVGPVQRICSALLPLIQRGFEGTAYGDPSKNEFLSYNLKYFRGPYMPKGTVSVPPGPMLISKGSLRTVNVLYMAEPSENPIIQWKLYLTSPWVGSTIGSLVTELLDQNEWLVPGEQLTFVWCLLDHDQYIWQYWSLILDEKDNRALPTWFGSVEGFEDQLTFIFNPNPNGVSVCAAGCVRSQPYGETSFRRSTCILECNENVELYNDAADVQNAVASYRDGEGTEDWEDDPTPEYQKIAYLCMVNVTADMVIVAEGTTIPQIQCLGYVTKGGDIGIFYKYSALDRKYVLLDAKAGNLKWATGTSWLTPGYNGSYQPAREYNSIYGTM